MLRFPHYKQLDRMDCGPTCIRIIAKYYGRNFTLQTLRKYADTNKDGASLLGISRAAEKIGFRSLATQINKSLIKEIELPVILHWQQKHFIVLYKIKNNVFYISDPASGLIEVSRSTFDKSWSEHSEHGVILMLATTPAFFTVENEDQRGLGWAFIFNYLQPYRKLVVQLFLGLLAGGLLQFLAPFLAQSIVDIGINTHNIKFIYLIIIAQLIIVGSQLSIDIIRSWILLHISTRVNLAILTDFLIKLMKLPMKFFDSRMTGDIMQRMSDQQKIQDFLTGSTITIIFSVFNFLVFSSILAYYSLFIFTVFILSSLLHAGWIVLFLKQRRTLNYRQFELAAKNQSNLVQLVGGMQEIKLNNYEQQKRWEWEKIQARLLQNTIKTLSLSQYQQGGATIITQCKNLIISFLSAAAVIDGSISLGSMVAIQYIVVQLSSPIEQLITFIRGFQDAKISLERLNEVHVMDDETNPSKETITDFSDKNIIIKQVKFTYPGAGNPIVLEDISFEIPEGKTTAIVGMSGSGKTTLLKLLLRFYEPDQGDINIGQLALSNISFQAWRNKCGTVMQDGFIFSDSIQNNICVSEEHPDSNKLNQAINVANLQDFISKLPLGLETKIGAEGNGISQGQKQRILIARAVYKNPQFIFFDEATNALDANNEKIIMNNLTDFFKGRTVVVVAHRLSTVTHADKVILLNKGRILEQGTHEELVALKKEYYLLVKNQLELGL